MPPRLHAPHRPARILSRWSRAALVAGLTLLGTLAHAAERVPLYTYYHEPPYAVDDSASLTRQLADWLTRKAEGRYRFEAIELPRRRLDLLIARPGWSGVVAWANPVWLEDPQQTRYAWSAPFMRDANLIVSRRERPVDDADAHTLQDLRLGGVLGRLYPELAPHIEAGRIVREDAPNERQNLMKLKRGRVDVAFIQAHALPHYRQIHPDLDDWLHVAPRPRVVFERHLAVARGNDALLQFLNRALADFARDPAWQALAHPGFAPP